MSKYIYSVKEQGYKLGDTAGFENDFDFVDSIICEDCLHYYRLWEDQHGEYTLVGCKVAKDELSELISDLKKMSDEEWNEQIDAWAEKKRYDKQHVISMFEAYLNNANQDKDSNFVYMMWQ